MSMQTAVRNLGKAIALGDHRQPTDSDLLRQFIDRRDDDSFRKLVERHGSTVKSVCFLGVRVSSLDISPDSNRIYYHEERFDVVDTFEPTESMIKVFNRKTKTHSVLFDGKRSRQKSVRASAEGRWLATTDELGVAYLWDTKTLFPGGIQP